MQKVRERKGGGRKGRGDEGRGRERGGKKPKGYQMIGSNWERLFIGR